MAGRKYYRKGKGKKKSYRRRNYKKRSYVNKVPRGVGFIAPRLLTRLKYTDNVTITMAAGTLSDYVYRLNGLYDPNKTGTGHQPHGFDQISSLYLRYRVYKCKWILQIPPTSDVTHVTVIPLNGTYTFTSISEASEYPKAITKSVSASSNTMYLKGSSYLPRLGGDKRSEYRSDDRFQSQITSNPSEVMDLHLVTFNPGTGSVTARTLITLIYYCEFYDPIPVGQS